MRSTFTRFLWRYGPIIGVFLAVIVLRLPDLLSRSYPPGRDIAEQVYWARIWLGQAFPGADPRSLIPPIYVVGVVASLIQVLPVFTAGLVIDIVVGALLVFPGYLLMVRLGLRPAFALLGSFLLAGGAAFSSMLSWNSGYNLFGICVFTFFLAFLFDALRTGRLRSEILAAVFLGVTAASNLLSLVVAAILLGLLIIVLLVHRERWLFLRRHLRVTAFCVLAFLPTLPIYIAYAGASYNIVGSSLGVTPYVVAENVLAIPFGGSLLPSFLALDYLDVAIAAFGIAVVVWKRDSRLVGTFLLAVLASSYLAALSDPGNFTRSFYYAPLAIFPAMMFAIQFGFDQIDRWLPKPSASTHPSPDGPPPSVTAPALSTKPRRRRIPLRARPFVLVGAVCVVMLLVSVNSMASVTTLESNSKYYTLMTPGTIAALGWLQSHAAPGVTVFSSDSYLGGWVWAYDNRQSIFPSDLSYLITKSSYDQSLAADFVAMGNYNIGDSTLDVGESSPSLADVPSIYLAIPGYWNTMFQGNANGTFLEVTGNHTVGSQTLSLENATVVGAATLSSAPESAALERTFEWVVAPRAPVVLHENISVSGGDVSMAWSSVTSGVSVTGAAVQLTIPPSLSQKVQHASLAHTCGSSSFVDSFTLLGAVFTASIGSTGASLCQWTEKSGFTLLNYTGGPALTVQIIGAPYSYDTMPYAMNSEEILNASQVHYLLLNSNDKFPGFGADLYARFSSGPMFPNLTAVSCFGSGGVYVLGLGDC